MNVRDEQRKRERERERETERERQTERDRVKRVREKDRKDMNGVTETLKKEGEGEVDGEGK